MKLFDLITEENDLLPEREGQRKVRTFSVLSKEGESADILLQTEKVRAEPATEDEYMFFIEIINFKCIKCDDRTMSRLFNEIGTHLISKIDDDRIYEWPYKIVSFGYYLGSITDTQFKIKFENGGTEFNNVIINRKRPVGDLFANVARPLPFRLDVESIEKEYYKAQKRIAFIQTEHFTEGEYDGYEYKTKLVHPRITSYHRFNMAPDELLTGRTVKIEGERIDISYDVKVKNKEILTSPKWEESLAKHVLHYYLINGVSVEYTYVNAMEPGMTMAARRNQFHFRRNEII